MQGEILLSGYLGHNIVHVQYNLVNYTPCEKDRSALLNGLENLSDDEMVGDFVTDSGQSVLEAGRIEGKVFTPT